jgi:hypothetical protein
MAPKKDPKITSPIKSPKISSMTHEENEEIQNQVSKLNSQINKLNDRSRKNVDSMNTQRQMGRKMDENKE